MPPPPSATIWGWRSSRRAGVAIGLAALGARTLGGESGVALETVILASSVLYELMGPACAKLSLYLSHSYTSRLEELVPDERIGAGEEPQPNEVELLIRRIQAIQADLEAEGMSEEEQAFLEAAEDQMAALGAVRGRRRLFVMQDALVLFLGSWAAELGTGSVLLRIGMAAALAAVIGYERSRKRHSAGLRTFIIVAVAAATASILETSLMMRGAAPWISAAVIVSAAMLSGSSVFFSSKGQIKGLTTSAGLWTCAVLGLAIGAGLYTAALIAGAALLCVLALLPAVETYLKDRSNHFEVHLELKNRSDLQNFAATIRRLGMRIDDIEWNPAYLHSGLSVYTVSFTIDSRELKRYKKHGEIIEALRSLEYIAFIEETR